MDDSHTVPIATAELEEFFTDGAPAYQAETSNSGQGSVVRDQPEKLCCVGIDTPGLGFTHALDCSVQPGATTHFPGDHLHRTVPPGLRRLLATPAMPLLRDDEFRSVDLALDLIFAARELAEANINCGDGRVFCE